MPCAMHDKRKEPKMLNANQFWSQEYGECLGLSGSENINVAYN